MRRQPVHWIIRSFLVALFLGALPAVAATITVNTLADELNADGDCSLREAVQAANTNAAVDACVAGTAGADTIVLPAGTIPVAATIQIDETVTIRGAGRTSTTIDRAVAGNTFNSSAAAVDIALDDLAMTGAMNASGGSLAAARVDFRPPGGTVNTLSGPITLTDVSLGSGNSVNSSSGALTLLRVTYAGGSINTSSGPISVTDTTISGGGRINSSTGSVTLTRSSITGANGTAINTSSSAIALAQSAISGSASNGINTSSGTVTLVDSSVTGSATYGINAGSSPVTLTRSLVAGSGDDGIDMSGGALTLTNSTVSGSQGLGINGYGSGTITLNAVTITGNTGGALNATIAAATAAVHAILGPNGGVNCGAPLASAQFSIDTGTSCGLSGAGNLPNTNPLLGPLANNGGPTFTHLPQAGSPAIDAGSNAPCQAVDQRGVTRPVDGDGNLTAACDIGAVEAGAGTPPPPPPPPPPSASIPTLTEWGLLLLVLIVALSASRVLPDTRRR